MTYRLRTKEGNHMEISYKLLVVDDELQIQVLLREFLTSLGHTVQLVGDGEEALQCLNTAPFDVVLVDVKMAKMGGMELLHRIKLSYPRLPVIMMTGYPSVEIAVEAMKEGAADFITKPLRLDALRLALARIGGNAPPHQSLSPHVGEAASAGPAPHATIPGK